MLGDYLTVATASHISGIPESDMLLMLQVGTIRGGIIQDTGETVVLALDILDNREQLPEYQKFSALRGVEIGIREGARKYNIPAPTITRWVQKGYIRSIGYSGRRRLIDEADLAYSAEVYRQSQGQGRRVFRDNGLPYIPKSNK